MTDTTKRRLLYLGVAIIVFLLVLRWKRPETAKQLLNGVVDGVKGGFQFPTVDTVTPTDYVPTVYNITPGSYTPGAMPGINFSGGDTIIRNGGDDSPCCGLCGKTVGSGDILPNSTRLQALSIAQGTTAEAVMQAAMYAAQVASITMPFGGSGYQ